MPPDLIGRFVGVDKIRPAAAQTAPATRSAVREKSLTRPLAGRQPAPPQPSHRPTDALETAAGEIPDFHARIATLAWSQPAPAASQLLPCRQHRRSGARSVGGSRALPDRDRPGRPCTSAPRRMTPVARWSRHFLIQLPTGSRLAFQPGGGLFSRNALLLGAAHPVPGNITGPIDPRNLGRGDLSDRSGVCTITPAEACPTAGTAASFGQTIPLIRIRRSVVPDVMYAKVA